MFKFKVKIFKNDLLVLAFQSDARHDEEIKDTPRARSATLRIIEKL